MELRSVDPRSLKENPDNPRKIAPDALSDQALAASIKAIGVLQPPVVREDPDGLTIVAGARRVRAAIALDWPEITVLARAPDDADGMRSLSENVVRAPMSNVDLWRAIEALASAHWTEEAIATALAVPVRQIKKLRLLAGVHPAILDQIGAGDMPREQELRIIASAPREDQVSVWRKHKPKKSQTASWWEISRALEKSRLYAKVAKFGPDEEQAFGVVWQEDLFAQGDEDNRFTTDVDAFVAAQQAWLEAHLPKNGVILEPDQYGQIKLPPKAERIWTKPKKTDRVGFAVHPRDGSIQEIAFRTPEPVKKSGRNAASDDHAPAAAKASRPEITQKGVALIGDLRTDALVKGLVENEIDDATLIGLLTLAIGAQNVSIRTNDYSHPQRGGLVRSITEGGRLTHDLDRLRDVARLMLANLLSCRPGASNSGLVARIAGDAIGADAHLADMANEDFLTCLSKSAIEKTAATLGVLPRPRAKDTRAELIREASRTTFIHPAARFALSPDEIAKHEANSLPVSFDDDEGDEFDEDGAADGDHRDARQTGEESYDADTDDEDADLSGDETPDAFSDESEAEDEDDDDDEDGDGLRAVPAHPRSVRSGAAR